MMRTILQILGALAAVSIASAASAQGRHDERPHGYDAKAVAAQQEKSATERAAKTVTPAVGPRAHDNPLRFAKIRVPAREPRPQAAKEDARPK